MGTDTCIIPPGATWTISGAIAGADGAWGFAAASDGSQVCCIQNGSSASQPIAFDDGSYQIAFHAAQRGYNPSGAQTVQVLLDDVSLGTFTAGGLAFEAFSTAVVTPGARVHTLRFQGLNVAGDSTMFVDAVRIVPAGVSPVGVVNGSFETPYVGNGYQYNPAGAGWAISGAIAGANGAWRQRRQRRATQSIR